MPDEFSKETIAVHAGRMSAEHFGVVNTPVYRASTVLHADIASLESNKTPYIYGRLATPTSRSLEEAITAMEGGKRTVLCPSGLNAITTAILSVCGAGDHLLMVDSCYSPARNFCEKFLPRFGVETSFYDPLIGDGIEALFRPNTKAVYCESPGSLTFEMQDIPAIAAVAHAHGASLLLDNTWATGFFFPSFELGVDLSLQSGTKYIGGHADVLIGCVTANASHEARLTGTHDLLGLCLSGDDCFLALRGLRTMPIRLLRHQQTGFKLARWLQARPEISRVLHPGLEGDPGHAIWKRDFKGASGLFGIELKPVEKAAVAAFTEGLAHFGLGYSWGGYESLIIPTHFKRTVRPFEAQGPLLRVHAGLADADDLIADLAAGFERMRAAR